MNYEAVREARLFSATRKYDAVDWSNFAEVVDAFGVRIREWYLDPAKALRSASGHFAFAALALCCILIDTLSQYRAGAPSSTNGVFKNFVKTRLPAFAINLPVPISHLTGKKPQTLTNVADVLYHAFRCGILHEAHVTPYGMIDGGVSDVHLESSGFTRYGDGKDCPSVLINPWALLDAVESELAAYLVELKCTAPVDSGLRANFKKKFSESFGVDISHSS